MLIDFCHHSVGSLIKSDKVSFDGYEINNLIATDLQQKSKGFMSDHFVKPPVNITVQFPCNISVDRVVIDPVIGQQRSHDIKIFTSSNRITDTWLYGGDNNTIKTDGLIFSQVGFVCQSNPSLLCLQNRRFQERKHWQRDDVCRYAVTGELRSSKPGALNNASHLSICVLRTKSSCSAAIKRLEIWGIPSTTVPYDLQAKLKKCYIESLFPSPSLETGVSVIISAQNDENNTSIVNEEGSDNGVIVPDDFKDEITWEIMACPIVLPSGKCVDQSTLDRFINTEASWGRPPSDPFTGLEFTHGRQPIQNTALKMRIDDFTFKHADIITVAKTLGRSVRGTSDSVSTSRLLNGQAHVDLGHIFESSAIPDFSSSPLNSRKRKIACGFKELKQSKYSRTSPKIVSVKLNANLNTTSISSPPVSLTTGHHTSTLSNHGVSTVTSGQSNQTFSSQSVLVPQQGDTHKSALSCSLDDALKNALGGLPSFNTKHTKTNSDLPFNRPESNGSNSELGNESDLLCNKCGVNCMASTVIKYRLVCRHLLCRNCVNTECKGFILCRVCDVKCSRDKLVRVF